MCFAAVGYRSWHMAFGLMCSDDLFNDDAWLNWENEGIDLELCNMAQSAQMLHFVKG